MKTHDVQSVSINASPERAFAYIADPGNLARWTSAFVQANARSARLQSPSGEVAIGLETLTHKASGTIDWVMTFPDGAVGRAYSRVTPERSGVVYSFVLMAPPGALEAVEGALAAQKAQLGGELLRLKALLESHD